MATPIGKQLQDARLARGLTLLDVQFQTRIPHALLAAMENDDLGAFSNPTYARKFFAAYAGHLGLQASAFLNRFHPVTLRGVVRHHPYLKPLSDRTGPPGRTGTGRHPAPPGLAGIIVGVVILALATGIVIGLSQRPVIHATPPDTPSSSTASTETSSPSAVSKDPVSSDPVSSSPSAIPIRLLPPPDLPVRRATPAEEVRPANAEPAADTSPSPTIQSPPAD